MMDQIHLPEQWDQYKPVCLLGEGAFGSVLQVQNEKGENFAVKIIPGVKDETELNMLLSLKDLPGIVKLYDAVLSEQEAADGEERKTLYLRMECLTDLGQWCLSHPIAEKEAIDMMLALCISLNSCEKAGVLHGDIKPENILVTKEGECRLGDFGIARLMSTSNTSSKVRGTFRYMAPEVWQGKSCDHRADIYSLGLVFYILMNRGRDPFTDPDKKILSTDDREQARRKRMKGDSLPPPVDASPEFWQIIRKTCASSPLDRYRKAKDLEKDLKELQKGKLQAGKLSSAGLSFQKKIRAAVYGFLLMAVLFAVTWACYPVVWREKCGSETCWTFYRYGTLVIEGHGEVSPPGYSALYPYCKKVKKLIVKKGVTSLTLDDERKRESSRESIGTDTFALAGEDTTTRPLVSLAGLFPGIEEVELPEGLRYIGPASFRGCGFLKEVRIPDTVRELETGLFVDCHSLRLVHLPENLEVIPERLFAGCEKLEEIQIPPSVKQIGEEAFYQTSWFEKGKENSDYFIVNGILLSWNGSSSRLIIPDGLRIRAIGAEAFSGHTELLEIRFPDTLEEICDWAMVGCPHLQTVHMGQRVERIGRGAFNDCCDLKEVQLSPLLEEIGSGAFVDCYDLNHVKIPESVREIGDYAFENCSNLNDLTLPQTLEFIGTGVFNGTPVKEQTTSGKFTVVNGILIHYNGHENEIVIPDDLGITGIAGQVFADRTGLRSIVLPDGLEWVGEGCFVDCENLIHITFPDSLTRISSTAFLNTKWQEAQLSGNPCLLINHTLLGYEDFPPDGTLIIPEEYGIRRIESFDLFGASAIKKIVIPDSVTEISEDAFKHCSHLKEAVFPDHFSREEINDLLKDTPCGKMAD